MKNVDPRRLIVKALIGHVKELKELEPISAKRKFSGVRANAFMLGVIFDKSINAERAWAAGEWVNELLGDDEDVSALWRNLATIEKSRLNGFLRYGRAGFSFHRYYKTFAAQLPQAAKLILEKYEGDPRKMWNNQRDVVEVRNRFEEIPGIGIKLSRMAVLILARDYGLLGGKDALRYLDVAPDIHLMRTFKRTGLLLPTDNREAAVAVAKELHPRYPGELDFPAYIIGQKWCRPTKPNCEECPLTSCCPREMSV